MVGDLTKKTFRWVEGAVLRCEGSEATDSLYVRSIGITDPRDLIVETDGSIRRIDLIVEASGSGFARPKDWQANPIRSDEIDICDVNFERFHSQSMILIACNRK